MANDGDNSKYLEGNYSDNPFKAVKEWWEDEEQARELADAEEYMKAYMEYEKSKREEYHYLVDGAVLKCTRCTMEPKKPFGKEFTAPEGSDKVILKVTKNKRYLNGAGQYFATIADSKKFDNIQPFGNCDNPPDRDDEKKALIMAGESEELLKLGNCRYLMKLNDEWENMISEVGYAETAELNEAGLEGITMESILFCKHGGFIYPDTSGYIMTETTLTKEEEEFADKYGLTEEQRAALFDIRKYFEEYPELMETTTVFAFEGLGVKLVEGEESIWNGRNTYHPDGQFGAIMIVTKQGVLSYAETKASTLPDNMEVSAAVCEGIYRLVPVKHKSLDANGYAAAQLRDFAHEESSAINAYNSLNKDDLATGVNLHMAGAIRSDAAIYSTACITVPVKVYRDFGVAVGFIKDLEENRNAGATGEYGTTKGELLYEDNINLDFQGCIVIDRKYYEDSGGYLKYNGEKGLNKEE